MTQTPKKKGIPEGVKLTFLTFDERKKIKSYIDKGYSLSDTAKLINRSKNGVLTEVRKNGGSKNYDPIKAEENARKPGLGRIAPTVEKRLHALEMQVQTLKEIIMELRRDTKN